MFRLFGLIALLLALAGGVTATAAQDGTPLASPAAGPCTAPELPPGTPTPLEATPLAEGTPDPAAAGEAVATEAATEAAPEATATPVGTPADPALTERIEAAADNLANCFNARDYLAVAALYTPGYLEAEFGVTNPYDFPALVEGFGPPPIAVRSIDDVQALADGRVTSDTVVVIGNQIERTRDFWVEQGEHVLLDVSADLPIEPPAGATTVDVTTTDFAFQLSQVTIPAGDLVLRGTNTGQYFHEIALARFPEGVEVSMAMMEAGSPEGTEFFGGNGGPAGASFDVVLVGLEPGTYTLLCFVDEPDGVPHVAKGMIAELTIE